MPFVQEGLIEILLLSVAAGLIGSWLVLRGLAFYSHAVGTATFPGLVLADGIGFPAVLGAFGMAAVFTAFAALLARARRSTVDSVTALTLVACMAAGVILASDVFSSGANVDTLLFGSLLAIDSGDIALAVASAILALAAVTLFGHHWLAKGFDEAAAGSLASGSRLFDLALMLVVAFAVIASLSAVGALLVAALMVIPAATVRMVTSRISTLQVGSIMLVAFEGIFGLWLSVKTDAPPGATIAVTSGVVFALVAIGRKIRPPRLATAAVVLLALGGLVIGCSGSDDNGSGAIRVVATTTQVADFVTQAGGDRVEVTGILKPNTDPHDYEPRPSDVAAVADAQVVFRSGGHLDEWTDQLIADSGSNAQIVDLSIDLPVELQDGEQGHEGKLRHSDEHDGEEIDPHWWHDPVNVAAATERIGRTLAEVSPGQARYFRKNAARYAHQARRLGRQIDSCIEAVPAGRRKIVTDHDAFGYFTNRFGLKTVGTVIPALTTQAQPSAGDLAELERTIRDQGVKAVFPESSISPKLAQAIARDTGATTEYSLYGDSLGPEGSGGETWLTMMRTNADNIVRGMTGGKRGCDFDGD